jgi:hypothetical protein
MARNWLATARARVVAPSKVRISCLLNRAFVRCTTDMPRPDSSQIQIVRTRLRETQPVASFAEHAVENHVDMLKVIFQIEFFAQLLWRQRSGHFRILAEQFEQ